MAQRSIRNRKRQLSTKELMQLILWGGLMLIIFLGLVYCLVRTGSIIPGNNGVAYRSEGIHGSAPGFQP